MAPVTMAFAEGVPTVATEKGKVFITDPGTAEYADTSFKGIQIFKATVTQNKDEGVWTGDKTLSDIAWANDSVMRAVTTAFDTDEPSLLVSQPTQTLNLLRRGPSSSKNTGTIKMVITSMPEACSTRSLPHLRTRI